MGFRIKIYILIQKIVELLTDNILPVILILWPWTSVILPGGVVLDTGTLVH
jgi:hypothetical protein